MKESSKLKPSWHAAHAACHDGSLSAYDDAPDVNTDYCLFFYSHRCKVTQMPVGRQYSLLGKFQCPDLTFFTDF